MPFNATTVTLEDSNLIEASAGTGKTYSIAIMVLRLVVEKNIEIRKILMVTFTRAAVAELELRVRAFIRLGLKVAREETIQDDTIRDIVKGQIDIEGREVILERLKQAELLLDETSVLTIHSFCQKVLTEYSFETQQLFRAESISPDAFSIMVEDQFNEYWRKNITTLEEELLLQLLGNGFKREDVLKLIKDGLSGKIPTVPNDLPADFLSNAYLQRLVNGFEETQRQINVLRDELLAELESIPDLPGLIAGNNQFAKNAYGELTDKESIPLLFQAIITNKDAAYTKKCFGEPFITKVNGMLDLQAQIETDFKRFIAQIAVHAYRYVNGQLLQGKLQSGDITFDDMILMVSKALDQAENQERLKRELNLKYQAVFIDEFQDTDREQYKIFHTLFGSSAILFFIGDPKQSIYGWRKADMATYFLASRQVRVQPIHTMNVNFRSSAAFIKAMNEFFLPVAGFDTFHYQQAADAITYVPVESPANNTKGQLLRNGVPPQPLLISNHQNKKEIGRGFRDLIRNLLFSGEYEIEKNGERNPVKPSDIGVLVRKNNEAKAIKNILSSMGVACVTIDDSKLFRSIEATELSYILMAVYEPTRGNINRALLTRIAGYSPETVQRLHAEELTEQFRGYQEVWKKDGVYVMLRQFLSDFNLSEKFYDAGLDNPERMVANVLQLVEIIHKMAEKKNYDPQHQIQWLKKGIDGEVREGDEYQQRLDRDENAVKIVTVHKSKGLEYNIVIAPYLDLTSDIPKMAKSFSYRDPASGEYRVVNKDIATDDEKGWYQTQTEQENRRLLYVAVTRARYQCFLMASTYYNDPAKSALACFRLTIEQVKNENPAALPHIGIWEIPQAAGGIIRMVEEQPQRTYAVANSFALTQENWRKSSFTSLSPEHSTVPSPRYEGLSEEAYDRFVFRDLRKGAQTGNLLHYIFENISFTDNRHWAEVVQKAVLRLSPGKPADFLSNLEKFVSEVLGVTLPLDGGFRLNQIANEDRLTELEFDFPLINMQPALLEALGTSDAPLFVRGREEMQGLMTGKIDLFFRHGGKFYLLDWKSNYLGEKTSDYERNQMQEAMNENNYHLQYHIYTVAAVKYLSQRMPDFDYEKHFGGVCYLFVRGVRKEQSTGIYLARPSWNTIQQLNELLNGKH